MMNVILVNELLDGEAGDPFVAFEDFVDALLRLNIRHGPFRPRFWPLQACMTGWKR